MRKAVRTAHPTHSAEKRQTVADHLNEIRWRIMVTAVFLVIGLLIGWAAQAPLTHILTKPLGDALYYSSPTGGLDFLMSLSICTGIIVALPVTIYNLLKFIEPIGRYKLARHGGWVIFFSIVLACAGASFAYYVSLPAALHFLKSFDELNIKPLIGAKEYLNFTLTYMLSFAVIFQLPLIITFIDRMKPIKPSKLFRKQRWFIIASFIIAAFATPTPDPINQVIMAMPLVLLFNISVICVWVQHLGRRGKQEVHVPAAIVDDGDRWVPVHVAPARPKLIVETVDRAKTPSFLPNFKHVTDRSLLMAQDHAGTARPLMRDVIAPQVSAA